MSDQNKMLEILARMHERVTENNQLTGQLLEEHMDLPGAVRVLLETSAQTIETLTSALVHMHEGYLCLQELIDNTH